MGILEMFLLLNACEEEKKNPPQQPWLGDLIYMYSWCDVELN